MKELVNFMKWQWRKFEMWQKVWIVGAAFFGAGIASPDNIRPYLISIPVVIVLGSILKWFLWDRIKESYTEYKKEKDQLFEKIKTSDKI